jgi:diguanylate cyclase (GGDEF)-like protein
MMTRTQRILVIDDDPMIHKLVEVRIRDLNVTMMGAHNGATGIEVAHSAQPHLILLDVGLPDMTGFNVCSRLRDDPLTREIPIIFLTGMDESEEKVRAFEMGAVDYVTKPFNAAELRARVRAALRTQSLLEALEMQALSDQLTGLPNREAFRRAVARCIEQSRQTEAGSRFALMFLDLDRFKLVNDSLGHAAGDQLLMAVANKLYQCIRMAPNPKQGRLQDVVARLGGDEFAILMHDVPNDDAIRSVADRILRATSQTYDLNGHHVACSASVGVRIGDASSTNVDDLLRDSDTAMYHAKHAGKARCLFFDDQMHEHAVNRLQQEEDLRHAIERREFTLMYQPIIDLRTNKLVSLEALVRWNHPTRGQLGPAEFIQLAEETGDILEIGRWVLSEACIQAREWNRRFRSDVKINVNVSRLQLASDSFVADVAQLLRNTCVEPSQLMIDVTETVLVHESRVVVPTLHRLHGLGVRLAMDDFGTGYSSLVSLHRFPIDTMKIDRDFTRRLSNNRPYAAIMNAIITLAHNLELTVVAKGVESADQLAMLQALECDHAQGFHFKEPLTADEVEAVLTSESVSAIAAA